MEFPIRKCVGILLCILAASATSSQSLSSSSTCKRDSIKFLHDLNSVCPLSITCPPPIQVDEESFESATSSIRNNEYTAVLFYASWCPFSSIFQSRFSSLSCMYPQIKHIMVQQSSVLPSVFSRYGIHSVPSLLIVNQTTIVKYYGKKDLHSVANFYKITTELDPVADVVEYTSWNTESDQKVLGPWKGTSMKEILREPCVLLSMIFVSIRALLHLFPGIASHMMAIWLAYIPRLTMGIFGESRQLIGRALHLIDVKRVWSKLRLCKSRKFHKGARNARVWASPLASVSLGETWSSRAFPSREL